MRKLNWLGNSLKNMKGFPEDAKREIGHALHGLQMDDDQQPRIKPLRGNPAFKGAAIRQISADAEGRAFRCVVTLEVAQEIYVLHALEKKATQGVATPKKEIDIILSRMQSLKEQSRKSA